MNTLTLQKTLGYLGVLPFLIPAVCALLSIPLFQLDPLEVFIAYSGIILSFLAGTLWGRCLGTEQVHAQERGLLLSSNAFALAAWLCLLLSRYPLALLILMLGFIAVLLVELGESIQMKRPYRRLRIQLTTVVLLLHGVLLVG